MEQSLRLPLLLFFPFLRESQSRALRALHDLSVTDKQIYTMSRVNWTTSNTSYSALTLYSVLLGGGPAR